MKIILNKTVSLLLGLSFIGLNISSFGQVLPQNTWGVKIADALPVRYTPTINALTGKGWEYSNSIVLHGMEKIYLQTNDTDYINYIQNYVDGYVNNTGTISGLGISLDKIHPGVLLLFLYEQTGKQKYKTAATNLRNYILNGTTFPKTPDGGYWHKNNPQYDRVMMLDGIYMAHPFLARYGAMFNDDVALNTATEQTLLLADHTYNSSLHLAMHAWHYDKIKTWADPATGVSSEVWSRAMGWYVMAIVDILKYLPSSHPDYNRMHSLLDELVIGIKDTQDPTSGLWWQVMTKGGSPGNYLETSGSAMFVYALKTAVDSNWIDQSYLSIAKKGWEGVKSKIAIYTDGMPQIKDFAFAMSVQDNYTGYVMNTSVNCPTPIGVQHPHAYAAVLMAASAMEFPIYTLTSNAVNGNITLSPTGMSYAKGDTVTVTATPDISYQFDIWSGDTTSSNNVIKIVMDKDKNITANFSIISGNIEAKNHYASVYPNPTIDGRLNIQIENMEEGFYDLKILNNKGQIVKSQKVNLHSNSFTIQLPDELPQGIYTIQIEGGNKKVVGKVVKE